MALHFLDDLAFLSASAGLQQGLAKCQALPVAVLRLGQGAQLSGQQDMVVQGIRLARQCLVQAGPAAQEAFARALGAVEALLEHLQASDADMGKEAAKP